MVIVRGGGLYERVVASWKIPILAAKKKKPKA